MTDKQLTEIRTEDETGIMLLTAEGILMTSKIEPHIMFWASEYPAPAYYDGELVYVNGYVPKR